MGFTVLNQKIEVVQAGHITLKASKNEPFEKCVDELIEWLCWEVLNSHLETNDTITEVACEMPQFFLNQRGFDTASRGDLTEMCFCVGRVAGAAEHVLGADFRPIPVVKWKGQLPKAVVVKRISKLVDTSLLSPQSKPSHDWDACGIGLFVKGKF